MMRLMSGMASPASPAGIAGAVVTLVVIEDHLGQLVELVDGLQDLVAVLTMGLDQLPSLPLQLPREVEHFVGHPDLAHVVHQAGEVGDVLLVLGEGHGLGDVGGPAGDGGRMAGGVVVLDVEGRHLALDRLQEQPLVAQGQGRVVLGQLALVGEGPEGVDEAEHREQAQHDEQGGVDLGDTAGLEGVGAVDVDEAEADGQEEEVEGEEGLEALPPDSHRADAAAQPADRNKQEVVQNLKKYPSSKSDGGHTDRRVVPVVTK